MGAWGARLLFEGPFAINLFERHVALQYHQPMSRRSSVEPLSFESFKAALQPYPTASIWLSMRQSDYRAEAVPYLADTFRVVDDPGEVYNASALAGSRCILLENDDVTCAGNLDLQERVAR